MVAKLGRKWRDGGRNEKETRIVKKEIKEGYTVQNRDQGKKGVCCSSLLE